MACNICCLGDVTILTIAKTNRMQYFLLIPTLVFCKAVGITAGVMARKIGADTWLSMMIGFVVGTVIILLMTYLCSRFPDKTVIQFSEELMGKLPGRIIGCLLALFFIMVYGASANVMTLHLVEYFLPETPFFMVCMFWTLLCMYGAFLGIEVVLRYALLSFIMTVLVCISMIAGTIKDVKLINILPLMDYGIWKDISSSIYIFGDIAFAVLTVGFLFPMLNKKKRVFSLTLWTMVVTAGLVVMWPFFETTVMGTELMKQYVVVCMQQIRCAQLTKYLPRYELIMVSFFVFSVFIQSAVLFHCAKHCIKQVTGLKKDWIIIVPLTVILILVTYFMAVDHNNYINFLSFPYSQICAAVSIGLPLILLFIALLKGKLKSSKL